MRLPPRDLSLGCVFPFVRAFKSAELLNHDIGPGKDGEEAESARRTQVDMFVLLRVYAKRRRQKEKEQEAPSEKHTRG